MLLPPLSTRLCTSAIANSGLSKQLRNLKTCQNGNQILINQVKL
ncbi:MAG: hypothetical protein V7K31_28180 [Nostoc sp.]